MADSAQLQLANIERRLARVLGERLPGSSAQIEMAPRPRPGWTPGQLPDQARRAAALILLYPDAATGEPMLVLTARAENLARHGGQISLPGGALEPGESIEDGALREAMEEIGIEPTRVRLIGRLTPMHIPVSGYILHPVVGCCDDAPAFVPDTKEVAEVLPAPLALLADPGRIRREAMRRGGAVFDVPYFELGPHKVWGATAMILAELLVALGARPWSEQPRG